MGLSADVALGMKRLTVIPWSCNQSGDCCRAINKLVMTVEEGEALRTAPTMRAEVWKSLTWEAVPGGFIALQAAPCPLLDGNRCTVYEVRPYNCRRWGCLRPNLDEQFEPDHGKFGCANARERVESNRDARRFMERLQSKAQRWAVNHGWRV